MNHWIERVEGNEVFKAVSDFEDTLVVAKEACQEETAHIDSWDRAYAVVQHLREVISQANPLLVNPANLSGISSGLMQAQAEIQNFTSNKNVGHWTNAHSHLDTALAHATAIPRLSITGLDDMRKEASSYRTSISKFLEGIRGNAEGITKTQADLQEKITEAITEITNQKSRLDNAISAFQQQFSDSQQTRQTEFSSAEQTRSATAIKNEEDRKLIFDEVQKLRSDEARNSTAAATAIHEELVTELKNSSANVVSALEAQKAHVQKLVGIISDTGMAHGFQKTANAENKEAKTWKAIAAWSLVSWIVIGCIFFALTYDKDLTLAAVARQFLISTPFVLLSGFAAMQVARHQKNERQMRQTELEIASIDPFLATLDDADRNEVKREFATRYFGQREVNEKAEPTPSSLIELTGALVKIVQEMTKK